MDLYKKKVITPLMPAFSTLKGMIAGIISASTVSKGAPMKSGVKIIFISTIAAVCTNAPRISAMTAVFLVLFLL